MNVTIKQFKDSEELSRNAAEYIVDQAEKCILDHGFFSLVLSGGSTPRRLYEQLAGDQCRRRISWDKTHIFWGDERCVPPDHFDSNYNMTAQALLSKVPLPERNIHRIKGEIAIPNEAAIQYEAEIGDFFRNHTAAIGDFPAFDLVLLGVGNDGHTASLFPGSDILTEKKRWVATSQAPPEMAVRDRITLTIPVINHASGVIFLVSGESKRDVVQIIIEDPGRNELYPSAMIRADGEIVWFVDFDVY
ncbi:MAG: 6-phosphogluconolactonase [Candidatus Latescibacteria bacterium]|nr:6-phosphogluconolactonase [Candidatus Latescibacterota bacterium]